MTFDEFWSNSFYKDSFGYAAPYYGLAKYAFEVGQNNTEWHDLRKNPDDLPKLEGDYLVCLTTNRVTCTLSFSMVDGMKAWLSDRCSDCTDYTELAMAWCEIPKFEEGPQRVC